MLHNLDSDSSKIIEAVRSTGVVITEAMRLYVDYIVSNMKAIGTWDLCNAVYGFVGGTAASHKWNWKNPIDTDAAFRATFINTSHTTNGLVFSGNGYANTFFNPSIHSVTDASIIHYTKSYTSGVENGLLSSVLGVVKRFASTHLSGNFFSQFKTNTYSVASTITTGVKISSTNTSGIKAYLRGQKVIDQSIVSGSFPNFNMPIGARFIDSGTGGFFVGEYMTGTISFFALSNQALTDTQSIQQSQIVTNAQNILNRA